MTRNGADAVDVPATAGLRSLNDAFRRTLVGGRVVVTAGVAALPPPTVRAVVECVKAFDGFSADNDPHGEHDFGVVEVGRIRFFWKIDTYDRALRHHSPDASDPAVTERVLTIMLASEY